MATPAQIAANRCNAARFSRIGFRRNVPFGGIWRGKSYRMKQIEAYAIRRYDGWLVISVVTRYF